MYKVSLSRKYKVEFHRIPPELRAKFLTGFSYSVEVTSARNSCKKPSAILLKWHAI